MKPLLLVLCWLTLSTTFAQTTFIVSSNDDDGPNSLREAITSVNNSTLTGPFTISITTPGPISLTNTLPNITQSCSIIGVSDTHTTIEKSATSSQRFDLFQISIWNDSQMQVTLAWLTLRGGAKAITSEAYQLILSHCILTQNEAYRGAALDMYGGQVLIDHCELSNNLATWGGGGIYLGVDQYESATLTVVNSSISSNTAPSGGGILQYYGGELYLINSRIESNQANLGGGLLMLGQSPFDQQGLIQNCSITNNRANKYGGAFGHIAFNKAASLTMTHTTISGNSSPDGAIYEELYAEPSSLPYSNLYDHCTITGNQTTSTTTASGVNSINMVIPMRNTIVANNTGGTGQIRASNAAHIQSLGHNLISDQMASFTATGDLQNTDPKLLPLADNGGSTLTHALRCSSPAVNAGVTGGISTDQRGVAYVGLPDMGAYEYQPLPLSAGTLQVSGTASCANPVRITAPAWGQSFVFTGPNGYVFSHVYRASGAYTAFADGVNVGGTYTLSVSDEEGCQTMKSTLVVQGPNSCP